MCFGCGVFDSAERSQTVLLTTTASRRATCCVCLMEQMGTDGATPATLRICPDVTANHFLEHACKDMQHVCMRLRETWHQHHTRRAERQKRNKPGTPDVVLLNKPRTSRDVIHPLPCVARLAPLERTTCWQAAKKHKHGPACLCSCKLADAKPDFSKKLSARLAHSGVQTSFGVMGCNAPQRDGGSLHLLCVVSALSVSSAHRASAVETF